MTMTVKNIMRARRIYSQIANYPDGFDFRVIADIFTEDVVRADVDSVAVVDVLSDLMHLCELGGLDFDDLARIAKDNYENDAITDAEAGD